MIRKVSVPLLCLHVLLWESVGFAIDKPVSTASRKPYVGMRYVGIPNGFRHLIGQSLEGGFGVTVVESGKDKIAWLGKVVGRRSDGKAEFEVLDVLVFPPLRRGEEIADICNNEKRGNRYTIVIGTIKDSSGERRTVNVRHAWQVNLERKKFEKISTKGIECIDPGQE